MIIAYIIGPIIISRVDSRIRYGLLISLVKAKREPYSQKPTDQILIDCPQLYCVWSKDFPSNNKLDTVLNCVHWHKQCLHVDALASIALNMHGHIRASELRKDASIFSLNLATLHAIHVVPSNQLQHYTISIWSVQKPVQISSDECAELFSRVFKFERIWGKFCDDFSHSSTKNKLTRLFSDV